MSLFPIIVLALFTANPEPIGPGDHTRTLRMGEQTRSYIVHVPKSYDRKKPTPVVLALHGAGMNGPLMVPFCGLNDKSEEAGFIAVYPSGTGAGNLLLIWNAGAFPGGVRYKVDDVAFIGKLLDDLATVTNVDAKRIYVAGMSNGGMMAYRLAAEMSDRIAAIAPVAGTLALDEVKPKRPVPVIHFHGTRDGLVPFNAPGAGNPAMRLKSGEDSVKLFVKVNGCPDEPTITELPNKAKDQLKVTRKVWGPGKDGAEVVLYVVEGGGHTWPGRDMPFEIVGKSTKNISANDLMWEFFQKHPMK